MDDKERLLECLGLLQVIKTPPTACNHKQDYMCIRFCGPPWFAQQKISLLSSER